MPGFLLFAVPATSATVATVVISRPWDAPALLWCSVPEMRVRQMKRRQLAEHSSKLGEQKKITTKSAENGWKKSGKFIKRCIERGKL